MNKDNSWDGGDYAKAWGGVGLACFLLALGMGSCKYLVNRSEIKPISRDDIKISRLEYDYLIKRDKTLTSLNLTTETLKRIEDFNNSKKKPTNN